MSSQRYSETQSFREESRRGNDGHNVPFNSGVSVPIQHSTSDFGNNNNEQRARERIRHQDTTLQWVNDPISGSEKFRVNINIDGFNQNEVNIRVEGNKLLVNGEHIENKNQSSAKKIIEKSYELPHDIETQSPQVSFPSTITMQVDFPSRYANSIIDDGRTSSKHISSLDASRRASPPRFSKETSSSEYTSTKKLGGSGGVGVTFERNSSPQRTSPYDTLYGGNNAGRSNTYSSATQYQSSGRQSPPRGGFGSSTTESFINSSNPTYTYRVTTGDSSPRKTNPTSSSHGSDFVQEKTYSETHQETSHRHSSPTAGVQSSREVEHHSSGNPSIGKGFDEDRFRSNISLGYPSATSPSTSRNVEVREYSRRLGSGANSINEPSLFAQGFNSDAFYRSAFQPEILTDNQGQKHVEMKLEVNNYEPSEIKVSVNGNDLIVQAEHNVDRPPTSSSRAYFYKQVTLPPNTDIGTLSSQYHPDGKLHITAKLSNEQASIRHN